MALLDFMLILKKRKIKSYLERDAVLLDVRDDDELKSDKLDEAIHIPLNQLKEGSERLKEMDKPVIVFCARGGRAAKAVEYLRLKNMDAINGGSIKLIKKLL